MPASLLVEDDERQRMLLTEEHAVESHEVGAAPNAREALAPVATSFRTQGDIGMNWSLKLGRIFGINFRVHVTFLLLLFFVFFSASAKGGAEAGTRAVLFICAVFACVLIHELAHSLIARRFGKEATSITLLPIGGVATMEEMPEKPTQEIAVAIIGPFINLVIAGVLYAFIGQWSGIAEPSFAPDSARAFFASLIAVNVMLAIFNLIPAFPMDGGRVLRGLLALKMDYVQATSTAVLIGQGFAMLFIFFGIFGNLWLVLIGFFLYMGAGSEKQHVMLRAVLRGVTARDAMVTDFRAVRPDERLSQVLERIYHGCQDDFPVIGDEGLVGVLTRNRILAAVHEKGVEVPVSEVMDRDFEVIDPGAPLEDVYRRLVTGQNAAAAVMEGGQLRGLICDGSIGRHFAIRAALRGLEPVPDGAPT